MLIAETYIEAIATHLNLDIDHVRAINLFKEGQLTPYHQAVVDWHVPRLLEDCKRDSEYEVRKKAVEQYNKEHRWRKRGIALVPTKFGLAFGVKAMNQGAALVSILLDGSVLVAHGGTEMGQGELRKTARSSNVGGLWLTLVLRQVCTPSASRSRLKSSESRSKPSSRARRPPTPSRTRSRPPLRQAVT
mgnify:CR=1 FL=1|jgi:xanthine dehydrogenase molybdopterin-binding subunit B